MGSNPVAELGLVGHLVSWGQGSRRGIYPGAVNRLKLGGRQPASKPRRLSREGNGGATHGGW